MVNENFKSKLSRRKESSIFVSAMDTASPFPFIISWKSVNLFRTEIILRQQKFKLDGLVLRKSLST